MKRMSLLLIRKPVEGQVGSAERAEHAASPDAGPRSLRSLGQSQVCAGVRHNDSRGWVMTKGTRVGMMAR